MNKEALVAKLNALVDSARARKTEQGIIVYEAVLSELSMAKTTSEVETIWRDLNRTLAGMERYGHFTDAEFSIIKELRRTAPRSHDGR